ncbi:MAG: hypothetical protein ACXVRJ_12975, partial [Gaiellaceae bacterium]
VRHNGWLYYQGGDQLWLYGSGWLLSHGVLPRTFVGPGLPVLDAPIARVAGPNLVPALPAIVLVNVLVLAPVALLCIYGIAQRMAGRVFAYWATLCWIVVPLIGIKYTDLGYHQIYTEATLPQSYGLTAMADFPSMVAVLVSVYFTFRIADRTDLVDGLAAGLAAGAAISIKPSNSIFLLGPILALAYRRRLRGAAYMAVGLAPALIAVTLWKYRGFGTVPLFQSQGAVRLALEGAGVGLVAFNPLHKYIQFDWAQLHNNLLGIKEHFWSMRVVEWLVLAGLIGVARRSLTGFLLIGGWFAAFVVTKGAWGGANIYGGSVFRIMMPSFPAFVLMLASLVFLWPRGRKGRRPAPPAPHSSLRPRTRLTLLGAAFLVFAVSPLVVIAAAQPLHGPDPPAYEVDVLLRPVDQALELTAVRIGDHVRLSWNDSQPSQARVFYRIWRSGSPNGGAVCTPVVGGSADCSLTMADVGVHPGGSWVDRPGSGRWTYRLALEANWLDLPGYGDVFTVGPPVTVRVP